MKKNKKITKEFKRMILSKAKIKRGTQADDIKLGDMSSWAMLFGNCEWYIPELDITCKGTCGEHCKGCFDPKNPRKSPCYVAKSYMKYTKRDDDGMVGDIQTNACSVKLGHAYKTVAMTMFREDLLLSLDKQLTKAKRKHSVVRINESGELTCYEDLALWCELARRHPETIFYLYTKNYDAVEVAVINNIITNNMFINISIWHESGINEYLRLQHHPRIRAFVLIDDVWNKEKYASKGLDITSMCGAYDSKGKMNHEVTCARCKKCFSSNNKCTGCNEH